jgi:sugar lactone lactonase YvrE
VALRLGELPGAGLIGGMEGCENLYLDPRSLRAYVTSLGGRIYLLDGPDGERLRVVRALDTGGYALGIDAGPDGRLYAGICPAASNREWKSPGGAIARLDRELGGFTLLTGPYPCLNGLAFDDQGRCFFASSNFNFLFPDGKLYVLQVGSGGQVAPPRLFADKVGLANGVLWDPASGRLLLSDTLQSIRSFSPRTGESRLEYRKAAFREAFDDFCLDAEGRLWMSDPVAWSLKMYDPARDLLIRFRIEGFGQASSCRVRREEGKQILYVTELRSPVKDRRFPYNGRGVLRVPLESFPPVP